MASNSETDRLPSARGRRGSASGSLGFSTRCMTASGSGAHAKDHLSEAPGDLNMHGQSVQASQSDTPAVKGKTRQPVQASQSDTSAGKGKTAVLNNLDAELDLVFQPPAKGIVSSAFDIDPKLLEGQVLKLHEAETGESYIIESNRHAAYWREVREAPDLENHHHADLVPQMDGLKSLCVSVKSSSVQGDEWKPLYLLPQHSMVRRRALALNMMPTDDRADFVNYYFDEKLARQLSPAQLPPNASGLIKIHQGVRGVARFRIGGSAGVIGLRVGSMTEIGWIYCGYRDDDNEFVPCSLILSEAPETVENMVRASVRHLGTISERESPESLSNSSVEDSEDIAMRRLAFRGRVATRHQDPARRDETQASEQDDLKGPGGEA